MVSFILCIGVIVLIVYTAFFISFIRNVQHMSNTFENFIKNTDKNLNETLVEIKGTLEHIKQITSDVSSITNEARQISDTVAILENGVHNLFGTIINILNANIYANVAGLKAGVKAASIALVNTLKERRKHDHD